jgi:hypothetical protein
MRRLFLALIVVSLVLPATAQMRGSRGGGGFSRPAAARAFRGTAPSHGVIRTVPNGRVSNFNRINRFGFHRRFGCGFNNSFAFNSIPNSFCGGFSSFGLGYGLPAYGYYDPGYTGAAYAPPTLEYDDTHDRQMNELVLDLRDQQRQLDYLIGSLQGQQQGYAPQQQAPPPQQGPAPRGSMLRQSRPSGASANAAPEHQQPATTLVFKDGHRVDVYNYVMAKGTLTVLDTGARQKIALTQLDLPATQKANDDRGVTFKAPVATVSLLCNPANPNISCRLHQEMSEAQRMLTP